MINFRFHLVSLTAVFLALALGIAIGAAVVDRATVDLLRDQLDNVEARTEETRERNDELRAQLEEWDRFASQAGFKLVDGVLAQPEGPVSVVVVAVVGTDRAAVEGLGNAVVAAGGRLVGTFWITEKWGLGSEEAARELSEAVGLDFVPSGGTLRRAALARLARSLTGFAEAPVLAGLEQAAFLEYEPSPLTPFELPELPVTGAQVALISEPAADVSTERVVVPLLEQLADVLPALLAGQPGRPEPDAQRELIPLLLADPQLSARVATVDSLGDIRGQIAAILALSEVAAGRVGHYGFGPGAERTVPEGG